MIRYSLQSESHSRSTDAIKKRTIKDKACTSLDNSRGLGFRI